MPDENKDHELSLDDIFSRLRREEDKRKVTGVPFKFLDAYTREDKNIFFGRDNETDDIFRKLYSGKLLLVYGKSGTGKSSIINCGLISKIPQEDIYAINIRCGRKAFDNFISEIRKYSKAETNNPVEILEDIFYEHSKPIALIIDQLEEIFILSDEGEREKLARGLNEILRSRLKINIILIIREEYFANLTEFEAFIPGLYGNRTRIERMSKPAAREAIIKPCKVCNVGIEDGLADKIIDQLIWQSEGLELTWLQILMDRLYRTATDRDPENPVIKHEDLAKLGRIGNVLSDFLDEQLRMMPHGDMGEAILKTMISTDGTKKQVSLNDIADTLQTTWHAANHNLIEGIIRHFINVRIVTEKDEQGYFELRHDAIAGRIYERMTAIEKELIEVKTFLENSYKIFEQRRILLSRNDLEYIALYENKLILNNELKDFIRLSKKNVRQARLRRRNITVAAAAALLIVFTGFTLWALNERTKAIKQRTIAEEQKNEAIKANRETESARIIAQEGENKAKANEAKAIEQQNIAEEQRQAALRANIEAQQSRKQALEEKNKAVENEDLAIQARKEAEESKNIAIRAKEIADYNYLKVKANNIIYYSQKVVETDPTVALRLAEYAISIDSMNPYNIERLNSIYYDIDNIFYTIVIRQDSLINAIAVSSDGKNILTGTSDNKVFLYDLRGNLLHVFEGNKEGINAVAFSPDGKSVLAGSDDKTARLWDLNGNLLQVFSGHRDKISSVAFSFDGKNILTGSNDKTVRLWDLKGNALQVISGDVGEISSVSFSPDAKMILAGSLNGKACLWNLEGKLLWTAVGSELQITSVAFSPDGTYIVTGGDNGTVFLWKTRGHIDRLYVGHIGGVSSVVFSPDGKNILVGARDGSVKLWNLKVNTFRVLRGHESSVSSIAFSPDGKKILTGSIDKTVRLWDLQRNLVQVFDEHEGVLNSVAYAPDGKSLLTVQAVEDKKVKFSMIKLWDLQGNLLQMIKAPSRVYSAAFSSDGKNILIGSYDGIVRLLDQRGNLIQEYRGGEAAISSVAFSPGGNNILAGSWDNTARIWDLKGNLLQVFKGHMGDISSVAFAPDGNSILTGSSDKTACIWDLQGNVLHRLIGHEDILSSVAFAPDGKSILTGSSDGTARLWDLQGNVLQIFKGHNKKIASVAFSADGKMILTGSRDKTARLWDLDGNMLQAFSGHTGEITSVAFSPDSKSFLTGSGDKTARLWDIKKTNKEFQKENVYEELSFTQKIKYEILEFENVLKMNDEKSLNEAAEYYYGAISSAANDKKNEYINNAMNLYNKLLTMNKSDLYNSRLESLKAVQKE
jgi:WD40 repeat protein